MGRGREALGSLRDLACTPVRERPGTITRDVRDGLVSLVGGSIWLGEVNGKTCETLLGGEQFSEQGEDMRSGGFIKLPQPFDQPTLVYGPDLIQDDLA